MNDYQKILDAYGLDTSSEIKPLGNGLINSTYIVTTPEGKRYVMQRINTNVFPDVDALQDNIERVTAHMRGKLTAQGVKDVERKCLHFVPNKIDGKTYVAITEEGATGYWRLMDYIDDSVTREAVTPESAEAAGRAFGEFQSMLADMSPLPVETIKDFHNMEFRLRQFDEAIANDAAGRLDGVRDLVNDIQTQRDIACTAERLQREGKLPVRVCHCDTKVSNMLFDRDGNVLCVIDLDTVMPGNILSDYGDFLRTAGNTAPEDEPDIDRIAINRPVVDAFTRGYLSTAGSFLTDVERSLLPHGQFRFAYMQAVRFLTDYLNGDTYYRINYPDHNLVRARAQWRLAQLAMNR
ncbi:MAG: aminoglycoside phosphotransferase family protein [Muribaculaceae bacterium]|nr:aminoglycoside phosphotransferase family protein [Muribaculaceae bacterium]